MAWDHSGQGEPQVFFGEESLGELKTKLDDASHKSVLLVTGRESYEKCGANRLLDPLLIDRKVTHISDFGTNPKKDDVVRILKEIDGIAYSAIIAVGGGSVMDVAKLIKCFKGAAVQIDDVLYLGEHAEPSQTALFALPTTAGSGSEATHFAVLYDRGVKYSVAHRELLPDAVWILPSVISTVPRDIAASAAMDAFCQGVESYWCIHSTPESKIIARQAIELAWKNMLPAAVDRNPTALNAMGQAAYLAGKAINITKTTAPHAISYALTAHFGIPHGHAVALTLPYIFKFNYRVGDSDNLDVRGVDYVKSTVMELCNMLGCDNPSGAFDAIIEKMKAMELMTDIYKLGIRTSADCDLIVKNGLSPERVSNNPRRLDEGDLREILDSMLGA